MASLRFNKRIYSKVAIERAAEAYAEVLRATHRTRGAYLEVDLQSRAARGGAISEGLAKEFANYVLYATLIARRA
ncbi:MAG: hypothetical protein HY906_15260 [Deltaproteobacteria bacterium]|nr:hypothetical protein [Deltaproteobacteria bacterium]